jgi:putative hemolysin
LLLELGIVAVLIVINGLLAMSELAIVSSRPARLTALVEKGVTGSRRALALASDPGKFLSTVQIGITLVGVLSGAFSGATLGARLSAWLVSVGLSQGAADALGVGAVVTLITYASLIIGELVPKQIALRDPEAVAVRVAPAMVLLENIAAAGVDFGSLRQGAAVGAWPAWRSRREGERGRDSYPCGRGRERGRA